MSGRRKPSATDERLLNDAVARLREHCLVTWPHPLSRRDMRALGFEPEPMTVDCNHGVPWTECTTCSKPARSP